MENGRGMKRSQSYLNAMSIVDFEEVRKGRARMPGVDWIGEKEVSLRIAKPDVSGQSS